MKGRGALPKGRKGRSYLFRRRRRNKLTNVRSAILDTLLHASRQFSFWAVDRHIRYLFFNETHRRMMEEFWGSPPVQGGRVLELVKEESYRGQAQKLYRRALRGETISLETALSDPRSRERSFHYVLTPLRVEGSGEVQGVLVVSVETTVVRRQEEALREAELDREVLIHNLDHQVKNTIQSVISTLTRELEELPKEGSPGLERAIRRLVTLSNLYDSAITGERLAFTSLSDHLGEVIAAIIADQHRSPVPVTRRMEAISLPTTNVLPLCQLTGELLSSILDQLQPEEEPHVLVTLERRSDSEAEVTVVASHGRSHPLRSSSFVSRLVEELNARLEVREGPPETVFKLRFHL